MSQTRVLVCIPSTVLAMVLAMGLSSSRAAAQPAAPGAQPPASSDSYVQLLGDARAQAATSGESSAAVGGGILYRGQNQSILILARADANGDALDTEAERGAMMLTPESTGRPSFEFDWRVYFLCIRNLHSLPRSRSCEERAESEKLERAQTRNWVDLGTRLYVSGGTSDWSIPADAPTAEPITRRASVLAYGAGAAVRRVFLDERASGDKNYVALESGLGVTARNLIGDLTASEHRDDLRAFLGTDTRFYPGAEFYIGLTINALHLGISLPVLFPGEVDGFSRGQLLVTAIVRDGPKLMVP